MHWSSVLVAPLVAIVTALAPVAGLPAAAGAAERGPMADVHGDSEQARFVGTGGLILPTTIEDGERRRVARCGDCEWRLTTPCVEADLGHPFDGQSPCLSVARGCPAMQQHLRAWTRAAGEDWRAVGLICLDERGPITVEQVGVAVAERFRSGLDRLTPSSQPARGVVTQLPVVFASGQPAGAQEHEYVLLGEAVRLRAWPTWSWAFGDGSVFETVDPGGRFPHTAVAHAYRTAGSFPVRVVTRWSAQYSVDGLGPFAVPEEVTQQRTLIVDVGEGRALLTAG